MSSYDTGEAKEDDAVTCDLINTLQQIPTEDGRETDNDRCQTMSNDETKVQMASQNEIKETDIGLNPNYTDTLRLHNVFEPKCSLEKQESSQSIKSQGRKVSFPTDSELVTGYLEPVNPWADGK